MLHAEKSKDLYWYKDAIIYELHIKAFKDGNGDGIGDFEGLLQTLDYFQDLGVTAIWLLPFYPSPLRDDGYDIADYYSVNPAYGDIRQFKKFLDEAHKRNLRVITELVINHTSDQHPWFQRARTSPAGSVERDFYVWTTDPSKYKDVRIIFQDYEKSNWSYDPVADQYYWHRFFHHQPDLNYDNPVVQEEILKVLNFWCSIGVDGFRLDAIPYLFEREGTNGENLPETHGFLKTIRRYVDEHFPGTVLLAEANMWPEEAASYFGTGDECNMNYHFPVMPRMFMALQMEDRFPITDIFDQTPAIPESCQWAIFLRNHDELTLEMVTDEERDYMYKTYAKDPKARINLGIRHRLLPLVGNSRPKTELLNCLLFSLSGTPVIYYGDEIGMGDNVYLGDRDGVRTPMQWSPDRNAGFSEANPQKLYLPLILDPEYQYEAVNVEMQQSNTSSLFWFMKRMIAMRKRLKVFGRGNMCFLKIDNPKVLGFTRTHENETLLVIANLSKFSQPADADLSAFRGFGVTELMSRNKFPMVKEDGSYFFTLAPYAFHWFMLTNPREEIADTEIIPAVELDIFESLDNPASITQFELNILPAYLSKMKWFNGLNKTFYSATIAHHTIISVGETKVWWLLIDVVYQSGLPETYQLVIDIIPEADGEKLKLTNPAAIIATTEMNGEKGYVCDGFYTAVLQNELIHKMAGQFSIPISEGTMDFYGNTELAKHWLGTDEIKSKLSAYGMDNTSITYDNRFFLKMYRKVDTSINPDLEITRYLTNGAKFSHMPAFIGAIEWKNDQDAIVLGILQEMIENHGDGYSYVRERMNNYIERLLANPRKDFTPLESTGTLVQPLRYEELPEELQILLGAAGAEQAALLGQRTGEMHLALAAGNTAEFIPESFSLHYQRSLFSNMQSLVRETFQRLGSQQQTADQPKIDAVIQNKNVILECLRQIYEKKFDAQKIRIHGNFQLAQVLLTGKDLAIQDYGGDPAHSYSERRLKRSPLLDVASMVSSFYHVSFEAFEKSPHIPAGVRDKWMPYYSLWAHFMSGFFVLSWVETVQGSLLIPNSEADLHTMLEIYLLQQALMDLNAQLFEDASKISVPLDMLISIMARSMV